MLDKYVEGEAFERRVARCEAFASAHPKSYRRRVLAMAWLGYWLMPTLLLLALVPPGWFYWDLFTRNYIWNDQFIYAGLWALYTYFIVDTFRTLFASPEPLDGFDLNEQDAPELFAMIEDVRAKLSAPRLDRVILDNELNAGAAQVSTSAFLGKTTNELTLGLPLLYALERDEFASVIAHEFGHFSGDHGRQSFLVNRTIRAWMLVLSTTESLIHPGNLMALAIGKWFLPRFLAYSFVLRREDEYIADQAAVTATNAETAARALVRLELVHHEEVRGAGDYWHKALFSPTAPEAPLDEIYAGLANAAVSPLAEGLLKVGLFDHEDPLDSHPILDLRLKAMGVEPQLPGPVVQSAAGLLGRAGAQALQHYNKLALEGMADSWPRDHRMHLERAREFKELEEKYTTGTISLDDVLRRTELARYSDTENYDDARIKLASQAVVSLPA